MHSRVGILTSGMWSKRTAISRLLGKEPVLIRPWWRPRCDEIAGWGYKPTAMRARRLAHALSLPYVAIEDGFLRSVYPGNSERNVGWVVDRGGIYYDSSTASDLGVAITRRSKAGAKPEEAIRIHSALKRIHELRLSKYNHAPMRSLQSLGLPSGGEFVFVIDQTVGDASVAGAGADEQTFSAMLNAAVEDNPGRHIAIKIHPEAISGKKRGYLSSFSGQRGVQVISDDVNPWSLIENATSIYVVSSQVGFEAMLAGVHVVTYGQSFYAGWGLTEDRCSPLPHKGNANITDIAAAAYLDYCKWIDPDTNQFIEFEQAIELLASKRGHDPIVQD